MLVVDLEKLQAAIDHMATFGQEVTECLEDVDHTMAALRSTWHGDGSESQAQAQRQWDEGADQMKAALDQFKKIAEGAHENYSDAVSKNGQMWGSSNVRVEVEPDVLVQSGQKLGSIGSQLGMLAAALGEALGSGIASGIDPAGANFGIKYGHQAQDFAKGMADATDAHKAVGFMLQATGYNYENADAASTIGGSGAGGPGAPPDRSTAADAKGINGVMVPPPTKWALIQTLLGPMWSWPSGNASMMKITAAQWRNFANGLSAFEGEMSALKGAVSQQHIPEAGKIGDALTDLATGVDSMAESASGMATAIEDFASGVQETQDAIRDLMDRISLDGLWDTVTGFLTGEGDDILREVAHDVKELLENFQSQVKGVVGLLGELTSLLGSAADAFEKWIRPILVEGLGDDVGNALADYVTWNTDVGVGAVTGLINTVSGVVSLADLDTWKGMAEVAASVAEDPTKLPGVLENMGKEFVAWDKWSGHHPGRAAAGPFNIGTLFVPGGALAKGGSVAKSLSYASRLFEEGRLPRISDLPGLGGADHGLPGFEGVPEARPRVPNVPAFNPGAVPDSIVSPSAPNAIDVPTSPASVGDSGGSTRPNTSGGPAPDSSGPSSSPSSPGPGAGGSPGSSASQGSSESSAPSQAPASGGGASPAAGNGADPASSEPGASPAGEAPQPRSESTRPDPETHGDPGPADELGSRGGDLGAGDEATPPSSPDSKHSQADVDAQRPPPDTAHPSISDTTDENHDDHAPDDRDHHDTQHEYHPVLDEDGHYVPGTLPSYDQLLDLTRSEPNSAHYWSGRDASGMGVGPDGSGIAERIAEGTNGTTLELTLERSGLDPLPAWNRHDPESVRFWEEASAAYAENARGDVTAVVGSDLRPGNIWQTVEIPRLMDNRNVTRIVQIDPDTGQAIEIFRRDD